ncbi:hypothetical protein [Pseudomonas putida]
MHAEYALWLNGNSLVLVDRAVSLSQAEDLLNIQLAAYLAAGKRHPRDATDWHKEYLRIQSGFGCNFSTLQAGAAADLQAQDLQPWNILANKLMQNVPSNIKAKVRECLSAYAAAPDARVQQLLWTECVTPVAASGSWHGRAELRVMCPGASIVSSELTFSTATELDPLWLWQPLDQASVQTLGQVGYIYQTDVRRVALIRKQLSDSVDTKKQQYRCLLDTRRGANA